MTIGSTVFKIEIATIFELVVPNSVKVIPARVEAIGTEGILICIETLDGRQLLERVSTDDLFTHLPKALEAIQSRLAPNTISKPETSTLDYEN